MNLKMLKVRLRVFEHITRNIIRNSNHNDKGNNFNLIRESDVQTAMGLTLSKLVRIRYLHYTFIQWKEKHKNCKVNNNNVNCKK